MKKYVAEFIGTFFLVLTVGLCAIKHSAGDFAPIAIGSVLMVMIYAGGHISGGHFNPAVTLAVYLRGRCSKADVPGYLVAQVLAGLAGSGLALYFTGNPTLSPNSLSSTHGLLGEFLATFALAYVVLNVATAKSTAGNSYFGLAIGFTVTAMAYASGPFSGGAFNPAVAIGLVVMQLARGADLWVYLVGTFAGGAAAAFAFAFLNPDDK